MAYQLVLAATGLAVLYVSYVKMRNLKQCVG